jgi:hypothetical protein
LKRNMHPSDRKLHCMQTLFQTATLLLINNLINRQTKAFRSNKNYAVPVILISKCSFNNNVV